MTWRCRRASRWRRRDDPVDLHELRRSTAAWRLMTLDMDLPTAEAIGAFYVRIRDRYPHPPSWRRELLGGRRRSLPRRRVPSSRSTATGSTSEALERIEARGRLDIARTGVSGACAVSCRGCPPGSSRFRFGTIGPSNHFVELQEVEEVFDEVAAARLGVRAGQMTVQYHGGGGVLAGQVGRLFGRRMKTSKYVRTQMAVQKPLYHLARAGSLEGRSFAGRCTSPTAVPTSRFGPEGEPLHARQRGSHELRVRVPRCRPTPPSCGSLVRRSVRRRHPSWSTRRTTRSTRRTSRTRRAIVHRHNSARAYPGVVDAGRDRLRRGRSGHSHPRHPPDLLLPLRRRLRPRTGACTRPATAPGRSSTPSRRAGVSGPSEDGHSTLRFRYGDDDPVAVEHLDDRGVDEALAILSRNDLVRPVARMRPVGGAELTPASVTTLRPPRAGPDVGGPAPAVDPLTGATVLLSVACVAPPDTSRSGQRRARRRHRTSRCRDDAAAPRLDP